MRNKLLILFALTTTALMFFSGCGGLPGISKIKVMNQSMETTTTQKITLDTVAECSSSGGECCVDDNRNGVCDIDESVGAMVEETLPEPTATTSTTIGYTTTSTTQIASTTTSATTSSTTSTTMQQSSARQCSSTTDCGEAYYGGCSCKDGNVLKVKYVPVCRNGSCIFLGRTETITCKKIESNDPIKMRESTTCVPGYGICISDQDREDYMRTPSNARIYVNLSSVEYSKEYKGYRFKKSATHYISEDNRCFDSMVFTIDVLTPKNEVVQMDVAWNQTAVVGDIEIGVDEIKRGFNMSDELSIWVVKT